MGLLLLNLDCFTYMVEHMWRHHRGEEGVSDGQASQYRSDYTGESPRSPRSSISSQKHEYATQVFKLIKVLLIIFVWFVELHKRF